MAQLTPAAPDAPTVLSTFTGAGGSCLGFRLAGFRVAAACEFISAARATYEANFPGVPVVAANIRDVRGEDLLRAAGVGEVDVLEGSPPCAHVSASGRREAGWGTERRYSDTRQRVDDLFFEFARIVAEVQPRIFVAENVPELASGTGRGLFNKVWTALRRAGYDVAAKTVDASRLGVPQARRRLILVGVRLDVAAAGWGAAACMPKPQGPRTSIRDALALLPEPDEGEQADRHTASIVGRSIHADWLRIGEGGRCRHRNFNLIRPFFDLPCPTITVTSGCTGAAGVCHPREPRKFTPLELRALTSFPLDFELTGDFRRRYERVARAVPPLMMYAVAERVRAGPLRATG